MRLLSRVSGLGSAPPHPGALSQRWPWVRPCPSLAAKERVLSNLQKHEAPQPPLALQPARPPVPVIVPSVLLSPKDAAQLVRADLNVLQQQAR